MAYLRTSQGSPGAPITWAAICGLISRCVQSLFYTGASQRCKRSWFVVVLQVLVLKHGPYYVRPPVCICGDTAQWYGRAGSLKNRKAPRALAVSAATVGGASRFLQVQAQWTALLVVKVVFRPCAVGRRPPAGRCAPAWARWAPGIRGGRVPHGTRVAPCGLLGPWPPRWAPLGPISFFDPQFALRRHSSFFGVSSRGSRAVSSLMASE